MKRRIFTIRSEVVIKNLTSFLESLPLEPEIEVIVQEKKKDRTVAQNRLYRLWGGEISENLGWSRKEVYAYLRRKFLVQIYERDDQGFAEMVDSIRKVYSMGMQKRATKIHDYIVERTSTGSATLKQFMEYLKEIERYAAENGIPLTFPDDRYYSAMGIKQQKKVKHENK